MLSTELVEQRLQGFIVVFQIIDHIADGLHESQRMVFEPLVVEKFLAFEMTKSEEGSKSRISSEHQLKDSCSSTPDVIADDSPLSGDYSLLLGVQNNVIADDSPLSGDYSLLLGVQNNVFVDVLVVVPGRRRQRSNGQLLTIY
jgi:hypothetical protein